jgi:hypothetical protein
MDPEECLSQDPARRGAKLGVAEKSIDTKHRAL